MIELSHHTAMLKKTDQKQKDEIAQLRKRLHDIEMAQAMLVDVGTSRRPDLQNAI